MLAQEGDGGAAADQAKKDNIFENPPRTKKIIRVITVMAYMVSVSFVAMVLSGYYIFLWQPPNPRLLHRAQLRADPQIEFRIDEKTAPRPMDITDRINAFREQFLRNRHNNSSLSAKGNYSNDEKRDASWKNDSEVSTIRKNETFHNDERISSAILNPIFRAFHAAKSDAPTSEEETTRYSVYESANNVPINGSIDDETPGMLTKSREINEKLGGNRSISSFSIKSKESTSRSIEDETFEPDVEVRRNHRAEYQDEMATQGFVNWTVDFNKTNEQTTMENNNEVTENSTSGSVSSELRERTIGTLKKEGKNRSGSNRRPHKLGSENARMSTNLIAINDTIDSKNRETNFSAQLPSTNFLSETSTEEMESASELSAIESSPLIIQPEPELPEEKIEKVDELLTQDTSDFDFI